MLAAYLTQQALPYCGGASYLRVRLGHLPYNGSTANLPFVCEHGTLMALSGSRATYAVLLGDPCTAPGFLTCTVCIRLGSTISCSAGCQAAALHEPKCMFLVNFSATVTHCQHHIINVAMFVLYYARRCVCVHACVFHYAALITLPSI